MGRRGMATQDRQSFGKDVPNAVIESECHSPSRFGSQQGVEIYYRNVATLKGIKKFRETFRRIRQDRAAFIDAVKSQDGAQSRSSMEASGFQDHIYVFEVALQVLLRCI